MYIDEEKKAKAEKLYNDNIRMTSHYVSKYSSYIKYGIFDYDDLVQTANLSLWKACLTFDDSKGHKFFTYASRCMLNDLTMFKNKSFKEDREDYLSYDSEISPGEESTFMDLFLLDPDSLGNPIDSVLFLNELEEKIEAYYLFEDKIKYVEIMKNMLKNYSLKELIEIFNYERKEVKSCYEIIKYLIDKSNDNNLEDVFTVKVNIYKYYKDFVVKSRKILKEYNSIKDDYGNEKRAAFKYYTLSDVAYDKLRSQGYSQLASNLKNKKYIQGGNEDDKTN